MTESMRRYCLYAIIWKKTLFDIRSKESFEMNWKQSFREDRLRICSSLYIWKYHLSTWMFRTSDDRWRLKKQKADRNSHSEISNQAIDSISLSFASQWNDRTKTYFDKKCSFEVNFRKRRKMNSSFLFSIVSRSNDYKKIHWYDFSVSHHWNRNSFVYKIEFFNLTNFILRRNSYNRRFLNIASETNSAKRRKFERNSHALTKSKNKNQRFFDENHRIRTKNFQKTDMIMLHDTRLNNQHFERLTFRWLKFFRIAQAFFQKDIYIIAKLNEAELRNTVSENKLKKFYSRKTVNFEIVSKNANQFEVSLKNSNAKFVNSILENDQFYFNEKDFEYLMNEKNIFRTEIKVKILAFSN